MSPFDLFQSLLVGGGLLVLYSLPISPVKKQLMQMVTKGPDQGGFSQHASPNRIKIARNINSLRYADDTTLMAERSEEELKSLLIKVKEESEKAGIKFDIKKHKVMALGPITSWQT